MQLTPRYLVKNLTEVILGNSGFIVEYRPVYERNLYVYKGIDNTLQFRVLNADQKPVDITEYTPYFVAFDEQGAQVLKLQGAGLQKDDSTVVKGVFSITIPESSVFDIKQQYLSYNIFLTNEDNINVLTYANGWFDMSGTIYISDDSFPQPLPSIEITNFTESNITSPVWTSDVVAIKENVSLGKSLYTSVVYSDGFSGDLLLQASLENQLTNGTIWATVETVSFDGSTPITWFNHKGSYRYIRFQTSTDPVTIDKIVVRN